MHNLNNRKSARFASSGPDCGENPRREGRRIAFAAALSAGVASLIVTSSMLTGYAFAGGDHAKPTIDPATLAAIDSANSLSKAFRFASTTIRPSVVSIEVVKHERAQPAMRFMPGGQGGAMPRGSNQFGMDPEELMRRFFGGGGGGMPMPSPEQRGMGSGVIIDGDGYIVTNNHVVSGADELKVKLDDGREFAGTVVGTDPETDLALVKVDAKSLPAASWGDSETIDQGDWVVAVGSPFGLEHTVTSGIVSAKQREGITPTAFENYIQTDAAINPGNSGGPLVNLRGEIVGINTAIRTQGGGNDGIGFAIPSSTVKDIVDGLRGGKVSRGYLGIMTQHLDEDLAKSFGFNGKGVLVAEAVPGDPAAKAGLQSEDIITKVNGKQVDSQRSLVSTVASLKPGENAKLEVFRAGKTIELSATLGERPSHGEASAPAAAEPAQPAEGARLGVRVAPLNDELREKFAIGDEHGVAIVEVQPDSPAAKAGLEPGDLILGVGGTAIDTPEAFVKAVKSLSKDDSLRLRVKSGGQVRFVLVR